MGSEMCIRDRLNSQIQDGETQKALQFGANIARQINAEPDPHRKAAIYQGARSLAAQNPNYDMSYVPEQYGEEAQQVLDSMYAQVYAPEKFMTFDKVAEQLPEGERASFMAIAQ